MSKILGIVGIAILIVIIIGVAVVQYTIWKNAD
jgi:hypothetical protein